MLAPANPSAIPLNALQQHYQRQQQWQTQWQAPSTSPAKGQIIVLTGDGFGKSNTAFGMGMAVLAQNRPLAVIQFLEAPSSHPARQFFGQHRLCQFHSFGQGCTWNNQDRVHNTNLVREAWGTATEKLQQPELALLILDDINLLIHHNYLNLDTVLRNLRQRHPALSVVLTGRHAPFELIDMADTCIDLREVRPASSTHTARPQLPPLFLPSGQQANNQSATQP